MRQTLLIVYSNLGLGGIPVRIVDIINRMGETHPNITITLILKKQKKFDRRHTIINPNIIIWDFHRFCPVDNTAIYIAWLWWKIYKLRPDTLLTFISAYAIPVLTTKALFFWRETRIIVNEAHYTSTIIKNMAFPLLQKWGIHLLYPLADTVITPTSAVKNDLTQAFNIPGGLIKIIPNWSRFTQKKIPHSHREFDIIYAGRIDRTKNILKILNILNILINGRVPSLSCQIIGEGTDLAVCQRLVTSYGLNNNIIFRKPMADISSYLCHSKILLFYPDEKAEGFPLSVLDAMACGTIVITKYFAGSEEVITDGKNGFIVRTELELKNYILYVLYNYSSLMGLIKSAKTTVSHYHSTVNIDQYTGVFHD